MGKLVCRATTRRRTLHLLWCGNMRGDAFRLTAAINVADLDEQVAPSLWYPSEMGNQKMQNGGFLHTAYHRTQVAGFVGKTSKVLVVKR
jgi:hypothetical protein